ncbi:MAG: thiol reductase thioredoxin, partial [Calditrichaeota bacterium]|nr:thiol reductase thioredoxin [Calditrichota bacterium]
IEQLAGEYEGKLKVGKIDVDVHQQMAMKYNVRGIPTLLIFKDGKPVEQIVGAYPKPAIVQKLTAHL